MPNLKAGKKELRKSKKRSSQNKLVKSDLKTVIKKTTKAINSKEKTAQKQVQKALKTIDKAAQKKIIKKQARNRKKSRLQKKFNTTLKK